MPFAPPTLSFLTARGIARAIVAAALLGVVPASAIAQARTDASGTRISEPVPATPSRWQAERDALDQSLRASVASASTPRELWVEGQWGDADPWARAALLAEARNRAPNEKLFIASLAVACLAPLQPLPEACDTTDRLADWAIRDADNGLPALLLAARARQRNNASAMIAYLEDAATKARFDDYASHAALLLWEAIRDLPGSADPAARALLAASYGLEPTPYPVRQIATLCHDAAQQPDPVRKACVGAGNALAQRGATWALRSAGARLALRGSEAASLAAAQRQVSEVQRRAYECAEAGNAIAAGLEAEDAAARSRAVAQWEARLRKDAVSGETAACAAG